MKEFVRNFIEILILIVVGGIWGLTWGFFCSKIFLNTTVSMIATIFGGFVIGYILAQEFVRIRNRKRG